MGAKEVLQMIVDGTNVFLTKEGREQVIFAALTLPLPAATLSPKSAASRRHDVMTSRINSDLGVI